MRLRETDNGGTQQVAVYTASTIRRQHSQRKLAQTIRVLRLRRCTYLALYLQSTKTTKSLTLHRRELCTWHYSITIVLLVDSKPEYWVHVTTAGHDILPTTGVLSACPNDSRSLKWGRTSQSKQRSLPY